MTYNAIDLFSGCGGLTEGLKQAGFNVVAGVELNRCAAEVYKLNHQKTVLFNKDIKEIDPITITETMMRRPLHLLAGCPPCQGFSSIRKRNRKNPVEDKRNELILEYYRLVKALKPYTVMLENVPGLTNYDHFIKVLSKLETDYHIDLRIVNVSKYGVPQRRRRLILLGARKDRFTHKLEIAEGSEEKKTVRDFIEHLENVQITNDPIHKIYAQHTKRIQKMISMIPKDGGSRVSLPKEYWLDCHKKIQSGFNDVYGRLSWDKVSSTITGGCLNPSKGRFLHPEEDRCISAREATLLQTFPLDYQFPANVSKTEIALLIGNALPPEFCKRQAKHVIHFLRNNIQR